MTLDWLNDAVSPAGDEVSETTIVPVKPSMLPNAMSVEPGVVEPCRTVKDVEPEVMLKSTTLMETSTERVVVPLLAVMVTVKVAGTWDETVKTEFAEPPETIVTLGGPNETVSPGEETVAARLRVPENPLTPLNVIVSLLGAPLSTVSDCWVAAIEKSVTLAEIVMECGAPPPIPVTVTV